MTSGMDDLRHELGEQGIPWDRACDLSRGRQSTARPATARPAAARPATARPAAASWSRKPSWLWRERKTVGWSASLGVLIGVISLVVTHQIFDGVGGHSSLIGQMLLWPIPYAQGTTAVLIGLSILLIGESYDWCKNTAAGVERTIQLLLGFLIAAVTPMVLVAAFFVALLLIISALIILFFVTIFEAATG